MRRLFALGAALAGCALLAPCVPSAHAVDLVLKSRAVCPGRPGSLPVSAVNVKGPGGLVGFDMGLKFRPRLASVPDPDNAFFYNRTDPEYPVIVTGIPWSPGGNAAPDLYVGVVKGVTPFDTSKLPDGAPRACIGLVQVAALADAPRGAVMEYGPAPYLIYTSYPVPILRPGASAAVSDLSVPGAPIYDEPVTIMDTMPGAPAPRFGQGDLRVPLHKVAIGLPGDLNADGQVDMRDATLLSSALRTFRPAYLSEYQRIVADVAPLNGYVPGKDPIGTGFYGGSYGDGKVDGQDLALILAKARGQAAARDFPVCELYSIG